MAETIGARTALYHRMIRLIAGLIAVFAVGANAAAQSQSQSPSPASFMRDPYAIFARARQAWEAQAYPDRMDYDVVVQTVRDGTPITERYGGYYDAAHNVIDVDPVSDYERAHPASGRGVKFTLVFIQVGKLEVPVDVMGVPELAPAYSFGIAHYVAPRASTSSELVHHIRDVYNDPSAQPTPLVVTNGIPVITREEATARSYTITLAGVELLDGKSVYHLKLVPVRDPRRFRLREIWVDTNTFLTWRLVNDGNFSNGPGSTSTWTVDFATVNGAQYIEQEHTDAKMKFEHTNLDGATIRFESIAPEDGYHLHAMFYPRPDLTVLREPGG